MTATCIFLHFPILHLVLTFPFFSFYFLSYILGYIIWPHIASGHEVFGKAVSFWSPSSLLIALIIVILFEVLNSDRLGDPFRKQREMPHPELSIHYSVCSFTVCIPFCIVLEGTRQKVTIFADLSLGKEC